MSVKNKKKIKECIWFHFAVNVCGCGLCCLLPREVAIRLNLFIIK